MRVKRLGYSEARMEYLALREKIRAEFAKGSSAAMIYHALKDGKKFTMGYRTFVRWVKIYNDGFTVVAAKKSHVCANEVQIATQQKNSTHSGEQSRGQANFSKMLNMKGSIPPDTTSDVL